MPAGESSAIPGAGASDDAASGDALSPALTVQESPTTRETIAVLRKWAGGGSTPAHCVITGPAGSGRTHLLDALGGVLPGGQVVRCSSSDSDWTQVIAPLEMEQGRRLLVDDLDQYDKAFLKRLFAVVREGRHRVAASMQTFDGRLARLWNAHLSQPREARLASLSDRARDVAAFLPHWARINGTQLPSDAAFENTVRSLMAMKLPRGFSDVARLLEQLSALGGAFWDPPDATMWIQAYTRTVLSPPTIRPAILVEGQTDVIYLEWVSELTIGSPPRDLEIEPCQSARKIPERAFACRNEGRPAVALFDYDHVGRELHDQMKNFELNSVVIPNRYDPMGGCAPEHLVQVVEVEDLVPTAEVERFVTQMQRQPELVIHVPRTGAKRIVIHADDKLELARWVRRNLGAESAERFRDLYNELRRALGLNQVSFQALADQPKYGDVEHP